MGDSRSQRSEPVSVRGEDVPPTPRVLPLYEGERCVRVSGIRQGATVEVFDESIITSEDAIATETARDVRNGTVMIHLGRSVSVNSQLTARQTLCHRSEKSARKQPKVWRSDMLLLHNDCRANAASEYSADINPLVGRSELNEQAQDWAEVLRFEFDGRSLQHSSSPDGENLTMWWPETDDSHHQNAFESWENEQDYFNPSEVYPDCCTGDHECVHYTQIIWSTTEELGCGVATDIDGRSLWVCRYRPAGNVSDDSPLGGGERKKLGKV